MKKRIEVERFHINKGDRNSASFCPVALAVGPQICGHVEITENGWIEIRPLEWQWREIEIPGKGKVRYEIQYAGWPVVK